MEIATTLSRKRISTITLFLERIDTVVHAAALKQLPAAEYNLIDFMKTNALISEK